VDISQRSATVIVVTGGEPLDPHLADDVPADALVIAADSGVDHAIAIGRRVDIAVGDFDSVTASGLQRCVDGGARIDRHPAAKDRTDLEIALDEALALAPPPECVVVLGGAGGRLDHLLANALLLAAPAYASLRIEARMGAARVHVVRDRVELTGRAGDLVTLLAVGGPACGVRTDGLVYPLHGEVLEPGSTRGVSNVLVSSQATVRLEHGVLLAVLPGEA
jgi:thiamine pyrophosphokinase